ncbi:hypothetical protein J5J86_04275 [Aquabacter sp. L1I39]|uniref:L,D-transpeptidase family protein n=1 Tax=Aquabacter sp. L1I39 TaxID=2820278 RepID=UPI001ADCE16B|nr:murein L,D-transpeptidase family protein [Aquabacter sp. L1I39]QTL04560.1 hypothetical protein J5J86_04275 [Aquabacter sp. L1I39]
MSRLLPLLPRLRLAALAAVAAVALAGCNGENYETSARARQPLSPQTLALISEKGMTPQSPILVRIYKQEAELEVWKQKTDGEFALFKTYPICRWSGDLGPKVKVGDRQAPEGFYTITPGQMNPNSNYYLSFNLGFPNAYDRSYGRSGDFLMVHGDCSSAGCYSMTDEQMAEIYALGREAFAGGQKSFQVQALPFRMTPTNMAKYRNNPNMPFWKNLKEGVDAFDVTMREPKVNVCDRRYVFNATAAPGRGFDATMACPSYTIPPAIAQAVQAKQHADEQKVAALVGSVSAPYSRAGIDGGMHPVFLASYKEKNPGQELKTIPPGPAPGTMPGRTTNPPNVADDGFSPVGSPANTHVTTNTYGRSLLALRAPEEPGSNPHAPAPAATLASGSLSIANLLGGGAKEEEAPDTSATMAANAPLPLPRPASAPSGSTASVYVPAPQQTASLATGSFVPAPGTLATGTFTPTR